MGFSTINESDLHKTIKTLYAEEYDGNTEVEMYDHVFDIYANRTVIEIQTGNISKLTPKLTDCLEKELNVILVHPLVETKRIETFKDEQLISRRKSPKKGNIYTLFKELTGIYPILLHPNFTLEIVFVDITEQREKLNEISQSKNNRRRLKKDWNKFNKKLDSINSKLILKTRDDYIKLLPADLPLQFSAKDLKQAFIQNKNFPASAAKSAHLIIWVLFRMKLIEFVTKKNRSNYYKISD